MGGKNDGQVDDQQHVPPGRESDEINQAVCQYQWPPEARFEHCGRVGEVDCHGVEVWRMVTVSALGPCQVWLSAAACSLGLPRRPTGLFPLICGPG